MSTSQAEFAWPGGDIPGPLSYRHRVVGERREAVLAALTDRLPSAMAGDASLRALHKNDSIIGRYRLEFNGTEWFVRITHRVGQPARERALVDYLLACGVPVNPIIAAGISVSWQGRTYRMDVRPFLAGRHFSGSLEDLEAVGATLRACHETLAQYGGAGGVQRAAEARFQRLAEVREGLKVVLDGGGLERFGAHLRQRRGWVRELVEQFDPMALLADPGAQCVHGEPHQANVLYAHDDGRAILIDFEESTRLYVPVAWDVAFLVQRFCLRDEPSRAVAAARLAAVAAGYGPLPAGLFAMMRRLAWCTFLVILELQLNQGIVSPRSEWDKFVALERQARRWEEAP